MCGIFACKTTETNAAQITLEALKTLEYRGYDSWGIAAIMDNEQWTMDNSKQKNIIVEKHVGKIGDASLNSQLSIVHSHVALGHTRWATHGGVTVPNAHPHLDEHSNYAVVQNGIVENYAELKSELIAKGHRFVSETDTEVIVHMIEELAKVLPFVDAVRHTFLRLTGLNAFVAMDKKTGTLVTVKNGSPLIIGKGEDNQSFVASDSVALALHTKTIYYMNDQEMVTLTSEGIRLYETSTGTEKEIRWEKLAYDVKATELGEYSHFLQKEIREQPEVLRQISIRQLTDKYQIPKLLAKGRIWLIGCGSAGYAALFGQYIFATAGIDARAVVGSEFGEYVDSVAADEIVIFLSQSGETIDLIETATILKRKHVHILAIVNREESTLARMADEVIYLLAGPEQCVLATKSLTAKLAVLLKLGTTDQEKTNQNIENVAQNIERLVAQETVHSVIRPIAARLAKSHDIFIIGRGSMYPVALECMMKIREVTYLHAEGIAGGELKHGTIALIEKDTPCIVIIPNDSQYAEMISNTMELRARGAYIIGFSVRHESCFDAHIPIPDCGDATGILSVVSAQLIAYEMALLMGRDPDKPRNLAKSVTVK